MTVYDTLCDRCEALNDYQPGDTRVTCWACGNRFAPPEVALATSDVTVVPPPFDALAEAMLEAASYGWHNPQANDRVAALRARLVR